MTELVAATQDFNYDFEYSFQNFVDVAGGIQWNPKFQKHIDNGIDWSLIAKAKLIIFTGGEDISPAIYGHENEYSYVNFERDKIELSILKYSLSLNKKILGVCRGHQLINAYFGGILVQDLRRCLKADHNHYHELDPLNGGGNTTKIFSQVNSLHHQGVTKAGRSLIPTSSHKGVIESCETKSIITTQFHPEFMSGKEAYAFFDFIKTWADLG